MCKSAMGPLKQWTRQEQTATLIVRSNLVNKQIQIVYLMSWMEFNFLYNPGSCQRLMMNDDRSRLVLLLLMWEGHDIADFFFSLE